MASFLLNQSWKIALLLLSGDAILAIQSIISKGQPLYFIHIYYSVGIVAAFFIGISIGKKAALWNYWGER
jgi:hypothetical protein